MYYVSAREQKILEKCKSEFYDSDDTILECLRKNGAFKIYKDISKLVEMPQPMVKKYIEKYGNKKNNEAIDLFHVFPYTEDFNLLSLKEFLTYWEAPLTENNSESDFYHGDWELEFSRISKPGRLYKKVHKEVENKENPLVFGHDEIFFESSRVLEKKIKKKAITKKYKILVLSIKAEKFNKGNMLQYYSLNYEYKNIEKYHKILSEIGYAGFRNGKIILSYEDFSSSYRVYYVKDWYINLNFIDYDNINGIVFFITKRSKADHSESMDAFIKRTIGKK